MRGPRPNLRSETSFPCLPPPHSQPRALPYDTLLYCPTSCSYRSVCGTDACRLQFTPPKHAKVVSSTRSQPWQRRDCRTTASWTNLRCGLHTRKQKQQDAVESAVSPAVDAVAQVNTHLQTFMSRNAPQPEEVIQPHVLEAAERSRDESVTTISYPKDLRGSVLMCAAQHSCPRVCTPFLLRTERCFSFARNRKYNNLRMSYRAPDEPRPNFQAEGGVKFNGRPSSDVTKGFERLYERVYY